MQDETLFAKRIRIGRLYDVYGSLLTVRQQKIMEQYFYDDLSLGEIAEELGLLEKVRKGGWKALSSRETGQIGGMVSRRKKAIEKEQETK